MFDFIRKIVENREARADAKAAAETQAIKNMEARADAKAAAETQAIKMNAETNKTKVATETEAIRMKFEAVKRRNRILSIVGGVTFLFLLGDYIYHDSEIFIKWNMKRHIRNGSSAATGINTSPSSASFYKFIRTGTRKLPPLGETPLLLVGPSGCGKSTVLHDFALELKSKKIPVVLVNFREFQINNQLGNKSGVDKSEVEDTGAPRPEGSILLSDLTEHICHRISFPYRRSYVTQLLSTATFGGFGINLSVKDIFPLDYFVANKAIDMLFECCVDIADEGTTPVLLFDEVYDLIKDNNLEKFGGGALFNKLGRLLCINCVDSQNLKAVAASSSYKMVRQFKQRTVLKDDKVRVFNLLDIEPELLIARLIKIGYSENEATKFLDVVGPRLRKLISPLKDDPRPELQSWIEEQMVAAADSFSLTFNPLNQTQRRRLLSLLNILEKEGSVPYIGEYGPFIDDFDLSRILFISGGSIIFQSRLHETYWAQNRDHLKKTYSQ
jgi:energy-coupling factor transporter ATP-binding protein EcfA2